MLRSASGSRRFSLILVSSLIVISNAVGADPAALEARVRERTAAIESKLIAWRRDFHEHPELGDQEVRTSKIVAEHLRSLGLDVKTGVARNGVVGILKGGKPGTCVALRADMDGLPVKEATELPFASKARGQYNGQEVDLMHACGHDAHTSMLMAGAEVLASLKDEIPGTIVFLFQPAEEGSSLFAPSAGKSWGAKLMLEEGVFEQTKPAAVFGLHVMPAPAGQISYRSGPAMASSDELQITITGKPGHGGMPWNTIDPVTTAAQVVVGLQTIVSRRTDLTASPAVVTIGTINGGTRFNIVPESVRMTGTVRAYDEKVRDQIHRDIRLTAEKIAESAGAKADVTVTKMYDTTINDEALTARMLPALQRAADGQVVIVPPTGGSEDFSFFARATPGLFVFLGITPHDQDAKQAPPNHSPRFFIDESALPVGTRTLATLAVDFLASTATAAK